MMGKLKAAIIGLGNIAWKYDSPSFPDADCQQTHAGAYLTNSEISLVGGCSPCAKDRLSFGNQYNLPVFENAGELLKKTSPDIISICSPNSMHFEHAALCIEASIPMIWLEKPPAESLEDLKRLKEMEDRSKSTVLVNFQRRYCECYQQLRSVYQNKILGKTMLIRMTYSRGLLVNGSHIIDTLFYILGDDVEVFLEYSLASGSSENPSFSLRTSNDLNILVAGVSLPYHCIDIELTCEKGRASVLYGGMQTHLEAKIEHELFPGYYRLSPQQPDILGAAGLSHAMRNALEDLITSHKHERKTRSNLSSSSNTLKIVDTVLKKATENKA